MTFSGLQNQKLCNEWSREPEWWVFYIYIATLTGSHKEVFVRKNSGRILFIEHRKEKIMNENKYMPYSFRNYSWRYWNKLESTLIYLSRRCLFNFSKLIYNVIYKLYYSLVYIRVFSSEHNRYKCSELLDWYLVTRWSFFAPELEKSDARRHVLDLSQSEQ